MAKKVQPVPRKDAEAMAAATASGKRPTSPPPAKRKPRAKKPAVKPELPDGQYNSVVWNPELNTYEVRPNKPADGFELSDFSEETKDRLREILDRKDIEATVAASIPRWLANTFTAGVLLLIVAAIFGAGVWAAGGIEVGPDAPVFNDCLSQAHAADRVSQVKVLRELATQPFDGTTVDGRIAAKEWFNANRFKSRADDYGVFTDAVAEAIAANSEEKLAAELEGK